MPYALFISIEMPTGLTTSPLDNDMAVTDGKAWNAFCLGKEAFFFGSKI